jgi:uncharacterized cupin superfamily protein
LSDKKKLMAVKAEEIPKRTKPSVYPEPFFSRMTGREKHQLGDFFGLKNFGVNLTRLLPGSQSSIFHYHTKQDEFVFVLEGTPTLVTDEGETLLEPGMCIGFAAGGSAHQIINRSANDALYIEIGDRTPGDEGIYPRDDLKADMGPDGKWKFTRKNGESY